MTVQYYLEYGIAVLSEIWQCSIIWNMAVQYYLELGFKKCRTKPEGSRHNKNREMEGRTYDKEPSALERMERE
jgi:hypothetical protein